MEKRKEFKIIPVEFVHIEDGDYILNSSDGEEYRVTGDISTKKGSMIRVHDDTFLELRNDIEHNDLEEIVILKDEVKAERFGDPDLTTSREKVTAVWPNTATKILLDQYRDLKPRVIRQEIRSMRYMWEIITEELKANGFHYELQQVESKWKSLKRSYRIRIIKGKRRSNALPLPFDNPPPKKTKMSPEEPFFDNRRTKIDAEETVSKTIFKLNTEEINKNLSLIVKAIERGLLKREKVEEAKYKQRERLINAIEKGNDLLSELLRKK